MPKNTKGVKGTKKQRTKIKDLPVSEKELTAKQKKHVKGGILIGLLLPSKPAPTFTAPTLTAPTQGIVLDSEWVLKK